MKFKQIKFLKVFYNLNKKKILVGRLALQNKQILFEYDLEFILKGYNLSPFKLPLQKGVFISQERTFEGLFGLFNDSIPDGWGRLLVDRTCQKYGISSESLTPLDRLFFVGTQGTGALSYEPLIKNLQPHSQDLNKISLEIKDFQKNNSDQFVEHLLSLEGASSGVRPKIVLWYKEAEWIIKFSSYLDEKDVGNIEYAYYLMALDAGIEMSKSRLFSTKNKSIFGTKRFDRTNNQKSVHMHSLSGLLNIDHRVPSVDYQTILKVTMHLTKNMQECEKQFKYCVFNVLSHNRDDHSKNFAFLMNDKGKWYVSPAYDLTFSFGPNGEHCSTIMGEGKDPNRENLLKLAQTCNIKKTTALQTIEQVKNSISNWKNFADKAKVSLKSKTKIKKILDTLCV